MMTMIVTARAAFVLTVSKTEIMCLQTNDEGKVSFTVTAAGQVYQQTVEFRYLGGAISVRGNASKIQRAWACFGRCKM